MVKSVPELFEAYTKARAEYDSADQRYSAASRDRTAALNAMNDAQKAFDQATSEVKKNAPRDSDWNRGHYERA